MPSFISDRESAPTTSVLGGRRPVWGRALESRVFVAGVFLILPHLVYAFLWWGGDHKTLGNDYVDHQPGQQLMFMQAVQDGDFPLWAPADSGGLPFAYYMFSGQFSPLVWLMMLFKPVFEGKLLDVLIHVHLIGLGMAGFFTYLLMRRLGLHPFAGVFAGVVFIFNFRMLDAFRYGMALDVVVWLPVLLYLIERMVARPRISLAVLYALAQFMLLVPGHMQEALYCLLYANLYFVVRAFMQIRNSAKGSVWRELARRGAAMGGGQVLGFGLCAVVLLPIVQDVLPLFTSRTTGDPAFYYTGQMTAADLFYSVFFPWFGSVHTLFYSTQIAWILCALAVMSLLRRPDSAEVGHRGLLVFFLVTWVLCVVYSLGQLTPLAEVINSLVPLLKSFRVQPRVMSVGMFNMAAVAAFGLHFLLVKREQLRGWVSRVVIAAPILFLVAGMGLAVGLAGGWIEVDAEHVALPLLWNISAHSPVMLQGQTQMVADMAGVVMAVALITLVLAILYRRRRIPASLLGIGVLLVCLVEVGIYHRRGSWMLDHAVASPVSAAFKSVDTFHNRIQADPEALYLYYNGPPPVGQQQFDSRFVETIPGSLRKLLSRGGPPAWRMFYQNVKGHEIPRTYVTPAACLVKGDDLGAIANMNPYACSVIDLSDPVNERASNDESLLALHESVLEDDPLDTRDRFRQLNSALEVRQYTSNRMQVEVETRQGGLLNYSDAYAEGWRASVDGSEVVLYRSNHLFKAVVLPPGRHVVEFRYDPPSFRLGLGMSLIALCMTAGLAGWGISMRLNRRVATGLILTVGASFGAFWIHSTIYEMAYRDGLVQFDPHAPRSPVRDYDALFIETNTAELQS